MLCRVQSGDCHLPRASRWPGRCSGLVPGIAPPAGSSLRRGAGCRRPLKATPSAAGGRRVWPRPAAVPKKPRNLPGLGWTGSDDGACGVRRQVKAQRPNLPPPQHPSQPYCAQAAPGQILATKMPVSFQFGLKRHLREGGKCRHRDLETNLRSLSESPVEMLETSREQGLEHGGDM